MSDPTRIDLTSMEWAALGPGVRARIVRRGGRVIRIVEFTPEFEERDWCRKAHIGWLVSGRLDVALNASKQRCERGLAVAASLIRVRIRLPSARP